MGFESIGFGRVSGPEQWKSLAPPQEFTEKTQSWNCLGLPRHQKQFASFEPAGEEEGEEVVEE
eukprot:9316345-Pyramimonas_sp.AAC.1